MRRKFRALDPVYLAIVAVLVTMLLAACAPAVPSPTPAPAKPAEAKPAAPAAAPTTAAAAPAPTAAPAAAKPTEVAAAKPAATAQPAATLKIGAMFPLSGGAASSGVLYRRGIEMAVAEINAAGGVSGVRFEAIFEDHQTEPKLAVTAFKKLVEVDKVPIVSNSWSSPVLATLPIADETKTLMLTGAANSPRLVNAGKYLLSNTANASWEAQVALNYVQKELKFKKMGIIFRNDDFGNGVKEFIEPLWKKMGGQVVVIEGHDPTAQDFTSLVAKVKAAGPEFIFIASSGAGQGTLVKQTREGGLNQQLVSYLGFEVPELLSVAGKAAEGAFWTSTALDVNDPKYKEYVARFKAKYNNEEPVNFSNLQYDLVNHVAQVTKELRAKGQALTGENFRNGFLAIKTFDGVTGKTTYREDGMSIRPLDFKTSKDGKFVVWKTAKELDALGVLKFEQ